MKSNCCQADMVEPNEDEVEAAGSLCEPIEEDK